MDMYRGGDSPSSVDIGRQQKVMLAHLFKVAQAMEQIDQLLQWLAASTIQHFRVQLVQLWTTQVDAMGLLTLQLRTQARQDQTLPEQAVANNDLALLAQRMAGEQRVYSAQAVESLFSRYRATLLKRYGLNYCAGSFTDAPALLPPVGGQAGIPVPFAMTTLIFTQDQPQPNLMPAISSIVNQAIIVAAHKSMLLPTNPIQQASPSQPLQQETLSLTELIPRHRQDADMLLLNNPFSSSAVIADKRARRLYTVIDGHANIAALCRSTGLNVKEVYTALRLLLNQKRIDLYEPNGQLANTDLLPDNL